jgi:hypothetical protein
MLAWSHYLVLLRIGGKDFGRMVLTEVRCGGENLRHDIAVLVFKPASTGGTT